jgi:tetratricopeptide (TPR) repeat protein
MRIGDYEVEGELARGNMGVVYRARDPGLDRPVAVKLMRSSLSADSALRARFEREAQALARVEHPNVLRVHAFGDHQGHGYLVTELVDGESLEARLRREGPLPVEAAVGLALELGKALSAAHAKGLLHRDIKPDNVLLPADGGPTRLTDFGLARDLEASHSGLTKTGLALGTPGYWPPEQATGRLEAVGPASDVYGLGATLYAMLLGRPPISARTAPEILAQLRERPASLRGDREEVPPDLDAVVLSCLEPDPADRYPSIEELVADLERVRAGEPVSVAPGGAGDRALGWVRRNRVAVGLGAGGALLVCGLLGAALTVDPAGSTPDPIEGRPAPAPAQAPAPERPATDPGPLPAVAQRAWDDARQQREAHELDGALEQFAFALKAAEGWPEEQTAIRRAMARTLIARASSVRGGHNNRKDQDQDYAAAEGLDPQDVEIVTAVGESRFERALDLSERGGGSPWQDRWFRRQFEEAREVLERALSLDPQRRRARQLLGFTLVHLKRYEEARAALEATLGEAPECDAWLYLGRAQAGCGAHDEAARSFSRGLAAAPPPTNQADAAFHAALRVGRGESYAALGEREKARADGEAVLDLFEGSNKLGSRARALVEGGGD